MKKKFFLRKMFFQKEAAITLSLIGVHQFFIALSVYYLTLLIQNYQSGVDFKYSLMMYFFCMLFPYIPAFLSFISMQKWINKAHFDFVQILTSGHLLFPTQFTNNTLKDKFDSIISRNSFSTISGYFLFIHDALSLLLNSIFSMFVIGLLLPTELVLGYFSSVFLSILIIFLSHKKLENAAVNSELKFIDYSSILAKGWNNLSLKNKINKNVWGYSLKKESEMYYKSTIHLQSLKQLTNGILASVALIPTAYLIYHIIFNGYSNAAVIAAIIVNLTRIFNILSSLNSLLHLLIDLPVMNANFKVLFSFEDFVDKTINMKPSGKITINEEIIYDYNDVFNMIKEKPSGRFTIRGNNGSGKTTLLYYLKKLFDEKAILMPSNHNLLMWGEDNKTLSSGQLAIQTIKKIHSQHEKFLLLDEWDANLDSQNKIEINQLLDELSTQKVILEVRH